tara:strand:+ start:67 stop:549 length:483 start_codon:yes stop_codon:yes gene_type:complete
MKIYSFIGYLNIKEIYICNEYDIEINNNNVPVIKIGYTNNNYNQRKEEAENNMIIKSEYTINGTQKIERLIHKILKSSKITSQLTLPIEKKVYNTYYTEYYHNYKNIIIIAIRFIMYYLDKYFLKIDDKRLSRHISFMLDEYLEKKYNMLITKEHPIFIK